MEICQRACCQGRQPPARQTAGEGGNDDARAAPRQYMALGHRCASTIALSGAAPGSTFGCQGKSEFARGTQPMHYGSRSSARGLRHDPVRAFLCVVFAAAFVGWLGVPGSHAQSNPNDCVGVGFDPKRPLVVSTVTAKPRAYFVKSAWEDASCPANTAACQSKAHLMPGSLVLTGRQLGPYTCVAYQPPRDRTQIWRKGWMLSSALSPVAPNPSPKLSDWIGNWVHAGGNITIAAGRHGGLAIEGEHTLPAAGGAHSGVIGAEAKPDGGILAFTDDGKVPFEEAKEGSCQVRMQLIGTILVVEDNGDCGGSAVTFTGLDRRQR